MAVVARSSTTYTLANNTEAQALFEDNTDMIGMSSEDLFSFDFDSDSVSDGDAFNKLFSNCIDTMASYVSVQTVKLPMSPDTHVSLPPRVNETSQVWANTGTFLAAPRNVLQANQEIEDYWKRPKTFECEYCSKRLYSRVAWNHHQVCHIRASLKCKYCSHTAMNLSSLRRHNMYYHGAVGKRYIFFDSC